MLRMGVAGSLSSLICDSCFHMVDTVNTRAKACISFSSKPVSSIGMAKEIWVKEGVVGYAKGYSACFYSATMCGFL